jgi:hypothetical protein
VRDVFEFSALTNCLISSTPKGLSVSSENEMKKKSVTAESNACCSVVFQTLQSTQNHRRETHLKSTIPRSKTVHYKSIEKVLYNNIT